MIRSIRHVGLVVNDLDKALKLWCEVLGFKIQRKLLESGEHIDLMIGLKEVKVTTVKLKAKDGCMLELLKFHSHPIKEKWQGKPYSVGFTHIALTVDNIDNTCKRLKDVGVNVPGPAQISADGQVKVLYVSLPEGALVELVEEL